INVGDTISNGVPGVGAGNIESAGAYDIYTFNGTTGQVLYVDLLSTTNASLDYELRTPGNGSLFGHAMYDDGGRVVLPANGTYTINVFDYLGPLTGTYSFTIL